MIVTVTSLKGGVGKTTTSTTIADAMARLATRYESPDARVLLSDLDHTGAAGIWLGMDQESCVFDYLVGEKPLENCVRYTGRMGLYLMPGNSRTKTAQTVYASEGNSLNKMAHMLSSLGEDFDHVVFDTPSSGLLQEAAIAVADVIIIPVQLEMLSTKLAVDTLGMVKQLREDADLRVIVLPTAQNARLNEHKANLLDLQHLFGDIVAEPIPQRIAVSEASAAGKTVLEYDVDGAVSAYMSLANRIHGGI